jgi:hypothetical protein
MPDIPGSARSVRITPDVPMQLRAPFVNGIRLTVKKGGSNMKCLSASAVAVRFWRFLCLRPLRDSGGAQDPVNDQKDVQVAARCGCAGAGRTVRN